MPKDRNLMNEFMVGVRGDEIHIMRSPSMISKEQALVLAAWLVALADDNDEFEEIRLQVNNL
jgi:hypothetical protein